MEGNRTSGAMDSIESLPKRKNVEITSGAVRQEGMEGWWDGVDSGRKEEHVNAAGMLTSCCCCGAGLGMGRKVCRMIQASTLWPLQHRTLLYDRRLQRLLNLQLPPMTTDR